MVFLVSDLLYLLFRFRPWYRMGRSIAGTNADGERRVGRHERLEEQLSCSFCGKSQPQVPQLIAGPPSSSATVRLNLMDTSVRRTILLVKSRDGIRRQGICKVLDITLSAEPTQEGAPRSPSTITT